MNGWATFWTWTIVVAMFFFAVVVVTVTFGGLRDIRDMLLSLKAHRKDTDHEA